jgi:hypothetical protein
MKGPKDRCRATESALFARYRTPGDRMPPEARSHVVDGIGSGGTNRRHGNEDARLSTKQVEENSNAPIVRYSLKHSGSVGE